MSESSHLGRNGPEADQNRQALRGLGVGEPVILLVLTSRGFERSLVLWETPEGLKRGNSLLAKVSNELVSLDDAIKGSRT